MVPLRSILRLCPSLVTSIQRNSLYTLAKPSLNLFKHNQTLATVHSVQIDGSRHYAKKPKANEAARNKGVRAVSYKLRDEQLRDIVDIDKYNAKLGKAIEGFQDDCVKHLSLRSTVGSIETVVVKCDGQRYELQDIAQIIRKNTKTIVINMADFPEKIKPALQALAKSGLNLNPQQDGTTIFVPVVKISKEHRASLAKNAKGLFVKCRDQIKNVQSEFIRKVTNNTQISVDDNMAARNQLTQMADEYVAKAEEIFKTKEKELLNS